MTVRARQVGTGAGGLALDIQVVVGSVERELGGKSRNSAKKRHTKCRDCPRYSKHVSSSC